MRAYGFGYGNLRRRSVEPPVSSLARKAKTTESQPVSDHEGEARKGIAGTGRPLDPSTRAFMGSRFGHDFSGVRVHTDGAAAESASHLQARAFTAGDRIAFGSGEYAPGRREGQHLLAHELAHVVQNRTGVQATGGVSNPGDAAERAADRAAGNALSGKGRAAETVGGAGAQIARQALFGPQGPFGPRAQAPAGPSQGETILESFLGRMWDKQSGSAAPFQATKNVLEGLTLIFGYPPSIRLDSVYPSIENVMTMLRPRIPATVDPNALKVLDRIPSQEKKLSDRAKTDPDADPAEPKFPDVPGAPKPPQAAKGYSDAAEAALKQAYDQFSKTVLGKELEKSLKEYVLSVDGIPFDVLVAGGVLTIIAVADPKLPSIPVSLAPGVKLKINISGKASEMPPLLRDLVRGHSTEAAQPGGSEKSVGVELTMTNEAAAEMAKAVGHFFAEAARWFAKGVVHIGTVIARSGIHLGQALLAAAGGAALGALIGGLAGGGVGALIGAGVGALVAGGLSVAGDLLSKKKTPKKKTEQPA